MNDRRNFLPLFLAVSLTTVVISSTGCGRSSSAETYESILRDFRNPPAADRSAPLWVWNDQMTREEIRTELAGFRDRGIGGVFIHPRPGLITPYLSDEWMSLWKYAVETGKSLGLRVWIYDEYSYPSGFAGGRVPAEMPDAALRGLRMTRVQGTPKTFARPPLVVLRQVLSHFEDVTGKVPTGHPDQGAYYVFDIVRQEPSPWFGGYTYVDLMRKDVTDKFLDVTLNAYKQAAGGEFGQAVPGAFQDEAEIALPGGADTVNYTPALFQAFLADWDYDLRPNLVSLFDEVGDWRRVRHNYYSTLLDLFIENWAKPYYAYCADNNLIFTGHYWEHEWPNPRVGPDNLAMFAYAQMPGIDILMNEWQTGPHAQFGSDRSVREIRSSANQLGRRRTLSETYGAGGWDMTFFDQKRIGDWEYALGVNFLTQHLSYATIKGARKRDHPLSFSYHEPWWASYNLLADYFGRLSAVLSAGEQVNRILVIEPTTSAWMHYSPVRESEDLRSIGEDFQNFVHLLEAHQVEYDLTSEKTLEEFASVGNRTLIVGRRAYGLVLLPPGMENLDDATFVLLRDYLMRGGKIICWPAPPDYVDGKLTEDVRTLAFGYSDRWLNSGPGDGFDKIRHLSPPPVVFSGPASHPGLLHQRREFDGGQLVFLVNTDPGNPAEGTMTLEGGSVEQWDPVTGSVRPHAFSRQKGGVEIPFSLPPGGSLLLCVLAKRARPVATPVRRFEEVPAQGEMSVVRQSPNVLTIDYCDLVMGGKTDRDLYFYDAQKRTFQFHGLPRNPWDSAVQYKTNILARDKFRPDSGFDAVFWFSALKGDAFDYDSLKAVVERPALFRVSINGHGVEPAPGEWWLDRDFAVYPIGSFVVAGRNRITVSAKPFTIHSELEPIYVLGDFRLTAAAKGFELRPPAPISPGSWAAQGLPFYGEAVAYRKTFTIPPGAGAKGVRYIVRLGSWCGSVAEVRVGGRPAGLIAFPPYERDITDALSPGPNEVTVVVTGTLKNTLGPFHNNPPLGRAWPVSFQQGAGGGYPPGSEYSVVSYGLFEDFKLFEEVGG